MNKVKPENIKTIKTCLNCKYWDTYLVENECFFSIERNNPLDFRNYRYKINRFNEHCIEWKEAL